MGLISWLTTKREIRKKKTSIEEIQDSIDNRMIIAKRFENPDREWKAMLKERRIEYIDKMIKSINKNLEIKGISPPIIQQLTRERELWEQLKKFLVNLTYSGSNPTILIKNNARHIIGTQNLAYIECSKMIRKVA
ncbi:MAG: hypothetical protein QW331_02250 [Candidatus Woesearchaeota archaeon]